MTGTRANDVLPIGAVVLDCADPWVLAEFYGQVLGWTPAADSDERWVTLVNPAGGTDLAFQRDPEFAAPTWPARERHQMSHLDVTVTDLPAQHERVLALGARLLDGSPETFRVYADPAGHPFCLCAC